jgi:hypothetical protein
MTREQLLERFEEIKKNHKIAAEPEMPPVTEMIKNLSNSVIKNIKNVASGNNLAVSEYEATARLNICKRCEFFNASQERCSKCGCKMAVKTYLKAESCPLKKW